METQPYMPDVVVLSFGRGENDVGLRDPALLTELADTGFNVQRCNNTQDLFTLLEPGRPFLVLIEGDGSAQMDAYTLSAILHSAVHVRVVMLVGAESADRLRALNCGADVCLSHPVSVPELIAVLNALQRRMRRPASSMREHTHTPPLTMDTSVWILTGRGWVLRAPNGAAVRLTSIERAFMQQLFQAPAKLLRRDEWDELCSSMEVPDRKGIRRNMDAMVSRLRRKVGMTRVDFPLNARRGIGYQFAGDAFIDERDHAFEQEIMDTP